MPSLFTKPAQSISKASISRPVTSDPSAKYTYQGETPWMQLPRTPPPIPEPPQASAPTGKARSSTTGTHIIDLYDQRRESSSGSKILHSKHGNSSRFTDSSSEYEDDDDESVLISSPSTSPSSFAFKVGSAIEEPGHLSTPEPPRAAASHLPLPPAPPALRIMKTFTQVPPNNVRHPPAPRTDALSRGLSRRFAPSKSNSPPGFPYSTAAHKVNSTIKPQPLMVRTRTDTRRQGYWLQLGTMRVDPKSLKRLEKVAEQERKRVEKEAQKVQRKMSKKARSYA